MVPIAVSYIFLAAEAALYSDDSSHLLLFFVDKIANGTGIIG